MTKDRAQEPRIQDCFVTLLKAVLQYKVHQPETFTAARVYFMVLRVVQEHTASWLACTREYSIVASVYRSKQHHDSMHKSVQYHGQGEQEHTALCLVCTSLSSIMANMYRSTALLLACNVQEYKVLWQAHTEVYSIVASTYNKTQYHGHLVQEHRSLLLACTRAHSIMASIFKCTSIYT